MTSALASPMPAALLPPVPRPERLLIVEDDSFSQQLIDLYLRRAGFQQLVAAEDGRAALDLVKSEAFDLVLLDLNLPRVSGVEVLRRLKRDGLLTDTPVIVISSMTNMEEIVQCLDLGAEGYLPKPFNVRLLDERVSACLEMRRLKRAAVAQIDQRQRDLSAVKALHARLNRAPETTDDARLGLACARLFRPAAEGGSDIGLVSRAGGDGPVWVALGSVAAEGAEAPLAAAYGLAVLRDVLTQTSSPDTALTAMNQQLCAATDGWACPPISLLLLALDPTTGAFGLTNAGAADGLLFDPQRGLTPIVADRGRPLGRRADAVYTVTLGTLPPDTALLLTGAGLTEAHDAGGVSFGDPRLKRCLDTLETSDPSALVATAQAALADFTGTVPQSADASLFALRRLQPPL